MNRPGFLGGSSDNAGRPEEQHAGAALEEAQRAQLGDPPRVELGLEGELEVVEGLVVRQPAELEAARAATPLEHAESLEMLRILEMGYEIRCVETQRDTIEVDTPEDIAALENYIAGRGDEAR